MNEQIGAGAAGDSRRIDRASAAVMLLLLLGFAVMLGRVVQLQVMPSAALAAHMGDRRSALTEPARRGDVLDRHGRILAATRFGQRCFIDPTKMRTPVDADILVLADVLRLPVEEIGPRILEKMVENQRRAVARKAAGSTDRAEPRLVAREGEGSDERAALPEIRYVALGGVLDDTQVERLKSLKIPGVNLETRSVREVIAGSSAASLLGKVGFDDEGLMGAEKLLEPRLEATSGRLEYVRDSRGRALWVDPGGYSPAQRGEDVRLSIDLQLQRIATEELQRGVEEADAQGGRCVMLDPSTGEILAMVDVIRPVANAVEYDFKHVIAKDNQAHGVRYQTIRYSPAALKHPELSRNRCVEDVYEPGSTFKPYMWCAVTELGLADPHETIDCEGGHWSTAYGRHIADVVPKDFQSWADVLVNSSNIGMIKVTQRLTAEQMWAAVVKFGFGKTTGLGLPGEASGLVTNLKQWSKYTHTSVATGYEVAVTPVQMVRAFSVFARSGEECGTLPGIRITGAGMGAEALESTDRAEPRSVARVTKRVLPREVAELARETMRGVTANLDKKLAAKTPAEAGWRYELFGKSGTAEIPLTAAPKGMKRPKGSDGYFSGQYNASFIAAGPVELPRVVCVVVIDDPGPQLVREKRHYGAHTAGPVVRRAMERGLSYLGAAPSAKMEVVRAQAE